MDQVHHLSRPRRRSRTRSGGGTMPVRRPAHPNVDTEPVADGVELLAEAALAQDASTVQRLIEHSLPHGWWRTCSELVGPAARRLGSYWSADRCSFVHVTLGVSLLHRTLRTSAGPPPSPRALRGRILITGAPGAQHTFGLLLTSERLRRDGWHVELGWPFARPALPSVRTFDAYGVSVSGPRDHEWAIGFTRAVEAGAPSSTLVLGGWGAGRFEAETGVRSRGADHRSLLA